MRSDYDLYSVPQVPGPAPNSASQRAAVLVPIIERETEPTILLTRRSEHLPTHAGQISFPGGREEPQDKGAIATALRETEEEVGLPRSHVTVAGRLDSYLTVTGYRIVPIVGIISPPFDLVLQKDEVAEAFEVPLSFVIDPRNHHLHSREFRGTIRDYYAMPYKNFYIWGATAHMLVNLSDVLRDKMNIQR